MKPLSRASIREVWPSEVQRKAPVVDIARLLVEHCQSLAGLFPGRVNFTQRFEAGCRVDEQIARGVADILDVAVENTVRHAHPAGLVALIALDCRKLANGNVCIDICDDGVGLPESYDMQSDGGTGFDFMHKQAEKLGARLAIETGPLGMCVRLTLPASI